ncbi:MAG: uroporphyrinogen-III synthase [Gemmatimonadales bacterium]
MAATVVVTASAGAFPGLLDALRAIPAAVEDTPLMSFAPPLDWAPVDEAIRGMMRYRAVAFTSPRSAQAFAARVRTLGADPAPGPEVWASGAGTAAALGGALGQPRMPDQHRVADRGAAAALAEALVAAGRAGAVLFPCGDLRRDELPARLRREDIEVDEVVCYRSVLAGETEARRAAARAQVLVVASPSVADLLARACPEGVRPALVAVGPTTAAVARACGWPPTRVASHPTARALAAAVRAALVSR